MRTTDEENEREPRIENETEREKEKCILLFSFECVIEFSVQAQILLETQRKKSNNGPLQTRR